ncbi:MAG TPA: DUF202 domain-containing protein [Stenotrophomonas sp.]|jgi:uncharacterized membrane protein YidH (DUF202 family)
MTQPAPHKTNVPLGPPADQLVRPGRVAETAPPPIPQVDPNDADRASVEYSHYRTGLSNHRTSLSEHRTSLSEFRTDLSAHRTDLSVDRTDMSMRRTGMSFQRTRMSADRTLMSIIRTALSLIGFGFTIYQVLGHLAQSLVVGLRPHAPRNFGIALVALGMLMLTLGIVYHVQFMRSLRAERAAMIHDGLVHGESPYPVSLTLLTASVLWLLGLLVISSMVFNIAPFG